LLQRVLVAIMLVRFCVIRLTDSPFSISMIPHIIGACAAMLFLVGLWTPFVGTLIAVVELWIAVTHVSDPWISIMLATIGEPNETWAKPSLVNLEYHAQNVFR
jgi:hypothetical protein